MDKLSPEAVLGSWVFAMLWKPAARVTQNVSSSTRVLHTATGNSLSPGHTSRSDHKELPRKSHVDSVLLDEILMFANIASRQQHIDDVISHGMGIFVTLHFVVVRHDDLGSHRYVHSDSISR